MGTDYTRCLELFKINDETFRCSLEHGHEGDHKEYWGGFKHKEEES